MGGLPIRFRDVKGKAHPFGRSNLICLGSHGYLGLGRLIIAIEQTKDAAYQFSGMRRLWFRLKHFVQEILGTRILRVFEYFFRRALLHDIAAIHKDDTVANFSGEAHFVGNDDHRHPLFR
ncbi:hypothetical protein SAMN04488076_1185 [Trichococcus palustris]|nr:hypothetical protein SAMN04488076_1185 [Trichococcus palustris]